jgi:ubiquinone biosynthesis protein COQ9
MTQTILPADPTLEELRAALAMPVARNAAFDGWTHAAITSAAYELGVDADLARLAFPGGATDMITAWFGAIDAELEQRCPPELLAAMKVRQRITHLLETRLDIVAPDKEAQRRALAILAMPQNAPLAARLLWRAADHMWRLAGDTATDFNHYTKRMTLSAVYASTVAVFIDDDSEDFEDSRAYLARRIDNVMQFEKVKAQAKKRRENLPSLSRFIGRMRYPAG